MQTTLVVSLLLLQALSLVQCKSAGSSIHVPIFGIRQEALKRHHQFPTISDDVSVVSILRGGESTATDTAIKPYSTWSDHVSLGTAEFTIIKPGDGSEDDPDGIPQRYLIAHKENREKAKEALDATLAWRVQEKVNTILQEPHESFELCQTIFPVYLPGRDKEGHLIMVQKPGKVRLDIAEQHNITEDQVLRHYLYVVEYIWNLLDPSPMPPDGLMTSIIDCDGVGMDMFSNQQFRSFGKKLVAIMSNHYPTRSYKTLIINAPKWIKLAFNLVKPLMRESTRKKITILNAGPQQDAILRELLGCGDDLPSCLARDKDDSAKDLSDIEKELRLVASVGLGSSSEAVTPS